MTPSDAPGLRGHDPAVEPIEPDRSVGELFGRLTKDLGELFRSEVQLAKVETKEEVQRAGKAAGMLAAGGFAGYLALLFVSLAIALWLAQVMNTGLAFFLVGVVYAAVAGGLLARGRRQMKAVDPVPHQTVETLKDLKEVTS
jgi:uncharacterized membrane protein YqjE